MRPWLVFCRELLQRDQCGGKRFGDDPSVVAGDSFSRHPLTPLVVAIAL
jgi:hypothetical protein